MFRDGFLENCPEGTLDNNKCYVSVMLFWKKTGVCEGKVHS